MPKTATEAERIANKLDQVKAENPGTCSVELDIIELGNLGALLQRAVAELSMSIALGDEQAASLAALCISTERKLREAGNAKWKL